MGEIKEYISDNFKQRNMGLLCDFATEINKIYTAVFPNDAVIQKILDDDASNAMLFVHHPLVWDLSKDPDVAWHKLNPELLERLKERGISIFNYHVPLDAFGMYSTSKTLAEALGIIIEKSFIEYGGVFCALIGTTDCKDIYEFNKKYTQVVGHRTKLRQYGESLFSNGKIAVAAGGGTDIFVLKELAANGLNTLVTGITICSNHTKPAHDFAKKHKINILGGTHYSSEKYACIAMCNYFNKLGLPSKFIEDAPCFEDL